MALSVTAVISEGEESAEIPSGFPQRAGSHDLAERLDASSKPSSPKHTVLIVDDDAGVRESLVALLEITGHSILQAADGERALNTVRQQHVDALVLDLAMPRLDGLAVLEAMGPPPPKVVVYSALEYYTPAQIRQRAVGGSVISILRKPCPPTELLAAIAEALGTG